MSHVPKVVSLVATALLIAAGIALAADPSKVPPKLSPSQTPPAKFARPDLVPVKKLSDQTLVRGFHVWCEGNKLVIHGYVQEAGTPRAGPFKVLASVNGSVWNIPGNPKTFSWGSYSHGHTLTYEFKGLSPGPGPIPGKVLVSVEVDSEKTVPELNEYNNVVTVTTIPCS